MIDYRVTSRRGLFYVTIVNISLSLLCDLALHIDLGSLSHASLAEGSMMNVVEVAVGPAFIGVFSVSLSKLILTFHRLSLLLKVS